MTLTSILPSLTSTPHRRSGSFTARSLDILSKFEISLKIHSYQVNGCFSLVKDHRNSYGNLRLSDWFNRPAILEQSENFDDLTRGMATQPEMQANQFCDSEVSEHTVPQCEPRWLLGCLSLQITQFLFRGNNQFGTDLKAFDVQRNRDHGLASYNDFRQFCGLPRAHHFEDFLDFISEEVINNTSCLSTTCVILWFWFWYQLFQQHK